MNRIFHLENSTDHLARAFDALATTVDALGTTLLFCPREARSPHFDRARDVVGEIHLESSSVEERSLYQCLIVALRSGEAISYFEGKNIRVEPSVADALRDVAPNSRDGRSDGGYFHPRGSSRPLLLRPGVNVRGSSRL